jgi:parallel beta-helix repeat protein
VSVVWLSRGLLSVVLGFLARTQVAARRCAWAATCVALLGAAETSDAAVFFVREVGDDGADGLTPETAFRTIGRGARAVANHGDRVVVGQGVYLEGNITPARSGIAGRPISIVADREGIETGDPPGEVLVLPGAEHTAAFRLMGQRHIVIEGFTVAGAFDAAVQVRPSPAAGPDRPERGQNSSHVTIRNLDIRDGAKRGIDIAASGPVHVEGNRILNHGSTGLAIEACVEPSQRCRGEPGERVEPVVSNNVIGMSAAHGIWIQHASGPLVQNNVVFSNGGTGILVRDAPDPQLVNNLVYESGEDGIALGTADLATPRPLVVNNTVYASRGWGLRIGSARAHSPGARNVNNIFARNGFGGITATTPSLHDYLAGFNINVDGYGHLTPSNVYHLDGDPLFVDPAGPDGILGGEGFADDDFRLQQGTAGGVSPAVDGGTTSEEVAGLTGSTAPDGSPDTGRIDIGFHYAASPEQRIEVRLPFMPVFVRMSGNNRNHGREPGDAMRSIKAAARLAKAGVTVVVGPGRYVEGDIFVQQGSGRMSFLADPHGSLTGDPPAPVVVDATGAETGFVLFNAPFVVVDGFHVTGARTAGIQVQRGSHHAWVRNNVTFSNLRRGIDVHDADDVSVTNNLSYANGTGGIQIGGRKGPGSRRARVLANTVYANGANGITVGPAEAVSSCARVRYNLAQGNAMSGFHLGHPRSWAASLAGYDAGYNVNTDRYGGWAPRPDSDLAVDPLFVDPAGADGVLGGSGFADDMFHLAQIAAGQTRDSPAVDLAPVGVEELGLEGRSTRADLVPDEGWLDLGYHYPVPGVGLDHRNVDRADVDPELPAACYAPLPADVDEFSANEDLCRLLPADSPPSGDCNGDGQVTIDELTRAVAIALDLASLDTCPTLDRNGDARVSIDELMLVILSAHC